MDQRTSSTINRHLKRFKGEDRDNVIKFLLVLGIKHYNLLYTGQDLHIPILEYLCGKYVADLSMPPAGKAPRATKSNANSNIKSNLGNRQFRLDSMAHYPFADNDGTVTDVLHSSSPEIDNLLNMGAPARKRLVLKVFDEMRFSKVGMRMSDVPEALDRLGLTVSAALRKVLERTGSGDTLGGYFAAPGGGAHHVTLHHFKRIVRRLLQLYKEGVRPEDVVQLFATNQQYDDSLPSDDACDGYGSSASDGDRETKRDGDCRDAFDVDSVDEDVQRRASNALTASRSTRMAQRRAASAHHATNPDQQHKTSLKHVTSKIAPVVAHDRKRYQQGIAKTNKDALRTVAQRRVDALTSTAIPLGFKDRHYFSEPRLFHSKPTVRSGDLASAVLHRSASTIRNQDFKRYSDLGTGLATMEIADAFLQGDVGREILSTTESDYRSFLGDDSNKHPSSAQRTAEVLFGVQPVSSLPAHEPMFPARTFPSSNAGDARLAVNAQYPVASEAIHRTHFNNSASAAAHAYPEDRRLSEKDSSTAGRLHNGVYARDGSGMHVSDYASSNGGHRLQGTSALHASTVYGSMGTNSYQHRTVQEKRVEDRLNESAKRLYEAPGWRSAQGGWAAEFGPPHTHMFQESEPVWKGEVKQPPEDVVRPWRRSSEQANSSKPHRDESDRFGTGSAEDRMAAALDAVSNETASLHSTYLRNEAEIDSMLMRTNHRVDSTTNRTNYSFSSSRGSPVEHYGLRSGEDAALWDQEDSVDSAVIGASSGARSGMMQTSRYHKSSTTASQNASSTAVEKMPEEADKQRVFADNYNRSLTADTPPSANTSSSSVGDHYNPYADEDAEDGLSGDDAEYAVSLDGSMALSAAVA